MPATVSAPLKSSTCYNKSKWMETGYEPNVGQNIKRVKYSQNLRQHCQIACKIVRVYLMQCIQKWAQEGFYSLLHNGLRASGIRKQERIHPSANKVLSYVAHGQYFHRKLLGNNDE